MVKTVLVAALAGGVGYVLGTRAGRERYEELKAKASELAHSPQAQDAAAKVATEVKKNTHKLPDPLKDVANNAADMVADAPKTQPADEHGTAPSAS